MATSSSRKTATASRSSRTSRAAKPRLPDGASSQQGTLIDRIKQQHREVEALLAEPGAEQDLTEIVEQLCKAWIPHTLIEEQILIPALQEGGANEPALAEAEIRRDLVKMLLADLRQSPSGPGATAKFAVLSSEIEQLIEVEERPDSGVLALAESHNVDLESLKPQVEAKEAELKTNTEGNSMSALEPTALRFPRSGTERQTEEYSSMPYDSNTRDRDERGRFESDDDRRGGGGSYRSRGNDRDRDQNGRFTSDDDRGGYRSRSSRDYDDDYRRSGSNGGGPDRDDNGRFTSSGGSSSRSSRYEDDDHRGGGRGQGGWFGDSEGHSEASRRGWESREGAGYSSRSSRDDEDDRRRGQGDGRGWYGDSRGHSEAAREGWDDRRGGSSSSSRSSRDDDDDRRGGGNGGRGRGWYGDSEGHAEAAREGWDDRRGGGSSSRSSRDDDDDRRGGGGRGHGGWFGDSRGHSEASRRGWEDRR